MRTKRRCLTLLRGRHCYVFWYYEGQESSLLASLVQLAAEPHTGFDWADAAVLTYQMTGKRIADTADCRVGISPQRPQEQVGNRLA